MGKQLPQIEKFVKHKMKLSANPFSLIASGGQTIEVRLFDKKRQEIKLGDTIEFSKLPNLEEKVTIEVTGLFIYPSFKDLFSDFPSESFGDKGWSVEELTEGMYKYYTKVDESEWGVLGIKISLKK